MIERLRLTTLRVERFELKGLRADLLKWKVGEIIAMSYELICFHTSIIRPLASRYAMVGSLCFLSHSSYVIPLTLSTISVALIWNFLIACNCLLLMKPPSFASMCDSKVSSATIYDYF